ncbi:hypothetical protein GCM10010460_24480 [Microbacterium terrae]|uniref:Uncharacterized protein n=2 Tax=Microbacterium terrae TaxID=69369 RepID=A0A0M2H9S0_9MICO|nr:hypothetical protein RS81_01442 [Microbacterium terrae]GLJ97667.1 hypothetical protein GCM10017594_08640 [Microbacterium terrae]
MHAAARILGTMSESVFSAGAEVVTPRGRGSVVDARATHSGTFVIGVEDATGEVTYFVEKAVRLANS